MNYQRRIQLADELKKGTRLQFAQRLYTISKKPKTNGYGEVVLKMHRYPKDRETITMIIPSYTELTVLVPKK